MLITNIIFNSNILLNLTTKITILTPDFVVQSDLFVSSFLSVLTLASLVLTFSKKGTAIHKVLGLLLTSIFTVFLWMFKTQLLFIYIVYILAFISAVLMLFLSVVMMLPISTISQYNQSSLSLLLLFTFGDEADWILLFVLIVLAFYIISYYIHLFYIAHAGTKQETIKGDLKEFLLTAGKENHSPFFALGKFYTFVIQFMSYFVFNEGVRKEAESIIDYYSDILTRYVQSKKPTFLIGNLFGLLLSFASFIHLFFLTVGQIVWWHAGVRPFYYVEAIIEIPDYLRVYKEDLLDVVQQTYMFASVLLPFILITITPYRNIATADLPSFASTQGIGEIKELLYGDFSLFLIFSTVVLLVALLGAAIMTRKVNR